MLLEVLGVLVDNAIRHGSEKGKVDIRVGEDYVVFVKTKEGFEVRKVKKVKEVGDKVLVERAF